MCQSRAFLFQLQIWFLWTIFKHFLKKDDQNIGIIKEAKEWAGELLSGQTKVAFQKVETEENLYTLNTD